MHEFRKIVDPKVKIGVGRDKSFKFPPIGFTYGVANRPSTPINGVINNYYGEAAEAELHSKYKQQEKVVCLSFSLFNSLFIEIRTQTSHQT